MDLVVVLIIVCIIIIIYQVSILYQNNYSKYRDIRRCKMMYSEVDHSSYCVVEPTKYGIQFSKQSADLLAQINLKVIGFLRALKNEYAGKNIQPLSKITEQMLKYYNQDNLKQTTEHKDSTSFTINKGSVLGMCISNGNKFIDQNVLMYVIIHELTHIGIQDVDHTPYFWSMFQLLLDFAIKNNIYEYTDYSKNPVNFCGLTIG